MQIQLDSAWTIGKQIGKGAFGRVHEATSTNGVGVAKFIPKEPGAERELLFDSRLAGARNVVPILDSGEHDNDWVIVMPRAERSLRDELISQGGPLDIPDAVKVLEDVSDALEDLLARDVVHRDIKPEYILLLNGNWALADFGISRYAEASTQANTHKYRLTPPYAAPEQWRLQRATGAADIYMRWESWPTNSSSVRRRLLLTGTFRMPTSMRLFQRQTHQENCTTSSSIAFRKLRKPVQPLGNSESSCS